MGWVDSKFCSEGAERPQTILIDHLKKPMTGQNIQNIANSIVLYFMSNKFSIWVFQPNLFTLNWSFKTNVPFPLFRAPKALSQPVYCPFKINHWLVVVVFCFAYLFFLPIHLIASNFFPFHIQPKHCLHLIGFSFFPSIFVVQICQC